MKKQPLKIIGITLSIALIISIFLVMYFSLFFPSSLARTYDKMGFNNLSLNYAEKAYLKDESLDNLIYLVNMSIKAKNSDSIVKYSNELLKRQDFLDYVKGIDNGNDYFDFVASQYVKTLYLTNGMQNAEIIEIAMNFSVDYRQSNAIQALILSGYENLDNDFLVLILARLQVFKSSNACPQASIAILDLDITNLQIIIK